MTNKDEMRTLIHVPVKSHLWFLEVNDETTIDFTKRSLRGRHPDSPVVDIEFFRRIKM